MQREGGRWAGVGERVDYYVGQWPTGLYWGNSMLRLVVSFSLTLARLDCKPCPVCPQERTDGTLRTHRSHSMWIEKVTGVASPHVVQTISPPSKLLQRIY